MRRNLKIMENAQVVRHAKELVGIVVRSKMQKTIVVEVMRLAPHRLYNKVMRRRKRYVVHDEKGVAKVGEKVRIVETKPISKTKHWRLGEVVKV